MAGDHGHGDGDKKAQEDHEKVMRILARASTVKTPEYPNYPSSYTSGSIPMTITGRFANERERLGPDFTEADRQWRIKWIKDQALHPHEPYTVPAMEKELFNPFRRIYKAPLDYVERNIFPKFMNKSKSQLSRKLIGASVMGWMMATYMWYTLKYHNANNWERFWGWRIRYGRPEVLPGDPAYPLVNPRPENEDFYDRGFKARKVFRTVHE